MDFCVFLVSGYSDQGYTSERSKQAPSPILNTKLAIQPLNAQRLRWMQMKEYGFDMVSVRKKVDLNDFFGRVPRQLVWRAFECLLMQLKMKFSTRRGVVAIPRVRRSLAKNKAAVSSKGMGTLMRKIMNEQMFPRLQQNATCSKDYFVLRLADIEKVIRLEFQTAMLRFGDANVCWIEGTTQG